MSAPASASSDVDPEIRAENPRIGADSWDVERLTLGKAVDDVDEGDLLGEVRLREALGERSADVPRAEHRDLPYACHRGLPAGARMTPRI
jgi:hypothetical protein